MTTVTTHTGITHTGITHTGITHTGITHTGTPDLVRIPAEPGAARLSAFVKAYDVRGVVGER